ncbi:MAG: hypothetical protein ACK4GE_00960 [Caldimicrobium sp.]
MERKTIFITFIFFLFLISSAFSQEQVEVVTPGNVEVKEDITYPVPYIPVLKGLSYQASESAILKTAGNVTGMLVLTGNYKTASLVEFYRVQMKAKGWVEMGSFTSKTTFLAFKRPEGHAFISISEGFVQTTVRIIFFLSGVN